MLKSFARFSESHGVDYKACLPKTAWPPTPANKIYVDDNDQKLNSLILNLENLLNNLAKDFNKFRPINSKGKYDPNLSYLKNDLFHLFSNQLLDCF